MKNGVVTLFISLGLLAKAQQPATVSGFVKDGQNKPLSGVTVVLFSVTDSIAVGQTQTGITGRYNFQTPSNGRYCLKATFTGMQAATTAVFEVSDKKEDSLVDIILTPQSKSLQNITITAATKPMQARDGKLIYHVDKSLAAQGTNAFDQVRKTPGITVDAEENLSLKGSSAITIMIDGKQTYLGGQQLSTYLKSLPAENLARIEVMATPSSQYDAAGNAGIINIVTKKYNQQGYALNLRAGIGTGKYLQSTNGFQGNIRTKAFNLFGSYNYRASLLTPFYERINF